MPAGRWFPGLDGGFRFATFGKTKCGLDSYELDGGRKDVASFRDPAKTFAPIEVIERLLEITELYGAAPRLYISADEDLASYLDSFGFDVYALTANTHGSFKTATRSALILPSGSRSHESFTAH
jgi:hypothetical protein